MNLSDLVARARSLSGIRLQSLRSDDQIEQVINESYQEVLGLQPWPFLRGNSTISMAAEATTLTLPTTFRYLTGVVLTMGDDETRLKQTTLDAIDEWDSDEVGEPEYYARQTDRILRIWPAPESAATVLVRGQVDYTLLDPSDEPVFAAQFHPILAYRAATRLLQEEGDDSGRSESYQMEAGGYLARMERYYISSNDIGIIRMGSQRERRRAR